MKISENNTAEDLPVTVSVPEFDLESQASFSAQRSKDFQKLLEDVQKAADSIPLTEAVLHSSAARCENQDGNVFTITLRVRTTSWFSGGELSERYTNKILADAGVVQYSATDSAFERFRKSQNEKFAIPSGHWTRDISKTG